MQQPRLGAQQDDHVHIPMLLARPRSLVSQLGILASLVVWGACTKGREQEAPPAQSVNGPYEYKQTRELVARVNDAARLLAARGEAAFAELRRPHSRWREGEAYIFVLDPKGDMLVHPDPALEGHNELSLKDIDGRPIIRGLIRAATAVPDKTQGWYHYRWPVPGEILPRWKSSYVRLVTSPSGRQLIVGSGIYNDRMEKAFVVDMVRDAKSQIETSGEAAFARLRDRTGPFVVKDAYVFVIDAHGIERVNPVLANLEGKNVLDVKDTRGKLMVREMLEVAKTQGSGWVDYMWPKPGESVSTQKSTYVSRANIDGTWLLVGAGVYLADAPKTPPDPNKLTAPQLMTLVREGATRVEQQGSATFAEFRDKGSKWFRDDTYFFVWDTDGTRVFHAADPTLEGQNASDAKDVLGRPYGKMFLEVAKSPTGEGWVHYMYPEPGGIFPTWKSTFLKRVVAPSGRQYLIGAGIYNMQMDRVFIVDVVDRAAALVAQRGEAAFAELRDKTGPFVFMDTYVFIDTPDGTEVVNPGQPSLEGRNVLDLRDVRGKAVAREYIAAAENKGSAWVDYYWYKPGHNTPTRKHTYVRKVQAGSDTYIVGSGVYLEE